MPIPPLLAAMVAITLTAIIMFFSRPRARLLAPSTSIARLELSIDAAAEIMEPLQILETQRPNKHATRNRRIQEPRDGEDIDDLNDRVQDFDGKHFRDDTNYEARKPRRPSGSLETVADPAMVIEMIEYMSLVTKEIDRELRERGGRQYWRYLIVGRVYHYKTKIVDWMEAMVEAR